MSTLRAIPWSPLLAGLAVLVFVAGFVAGSAATALVLRRPARRTHADTDAGDTHTQEWVRRGAAAATCASVRSQRIRAGALKPSYDGRAKGPGIEPSKPWPRH